MCTWPLELLGAGGFEERRRALELCRQQGQSTHAGGGGEDTQSQQTKDAHRDMRAAAHRPRTTRTRGSS